MIGAVVLFEIAVSGAPRVPVSAEPVDLSRAAARIQINRKALEGWVPVKGTPAPVAPLPEVVYVPAREERRRRAEPPPESEVSEYEEESVNSFTGPRPVFYGAWPAYPPRVPRAGGHGTRSPHPAPQFVPGAVPPDPRVAPPHTAAGRTGPARRGTL